MSDLQDALDLWETKLVSAHGWDIDHDTMLAILTVNEAARRGANPDLKAAVSVLVGAYDVPPITAKIMARYAVFAALGIDSSKDT